GPGRTVQRLSHHGRRRALHTWRRGVGGWGGAVEGIAAEGVVMPGHNPDISPVIVRPTRTVVIADGPAARSIGRAEGCEVLDAIALVVGNGSIAVGPSPEDHADEPLVEQLADMGKEILCPIVL